jgi:pyruvate/2-oxoglutarate dehydrogenase complex dihydrolipoamide acyltransferase (E2) component
MSRTGRASTRRRLAVATWAPSRDGRIYTRVPVDAGPLQRYIETARAATGLPVTVTHVVGAALGRVLRAVPDVNARVVIGRIRPYPTCDVGFAVDIADGRDLAPFTVRSIDTKSPVDVAREVVAGVTRLRAGDDRHHRRSSGIVRMMPTVLMRPALALTGVLVGGLGVGAFGQPAFPLGGAFVSNVGSLGLEEAFLAPVPFARVPLYIAIGAIRPAAAVVDGVVVARDELVITATADHRLIDGAHAGRIATLLQELLADPARLDGTDPHAAAP